MVSIGIRVGLNAAAIAVSVASASGVAAQSAAASTDTPAPTSAEACAVMQAAYTAISKSAVPAVPLDVRPERRPRLELSRMVSEFRDAIGLQPAELAELASRAPLYQRTNHLPNCRWHGALTPTTDDQGHTMSVSFINPIFSADGRIAVTQASFREDNEHGIYAYGVMCVLRASDEGWSSVCEQSWIT